MGTAYWQPLLDFLRQTLLAQGTIQAADLALLTVTPYNFSAIITTPMMATSLNMDFRVLFILIIQRLF
jgi:hypothetical protein